jgi:hypothetical protein
MNRLLTGAAHAVQLYTGHTHREASLQHSEASNIGALLIDGGDHSSDNIFHITLGNATSSNELVQCVREEVNGVNVMQRAVRFAAPDWGTDTFNNINIARHCG